MRNPVNGSAVAATSGDNLCEESRFDETLCCQSGRGYSADTPPRLPIDSGGLNQACSPSHTPLGSVDNVVPPTAVISGVDDNASKPTSEAPGGVDQSSPPLHCSPPLSPV